MRSPRMPDPSPEELQQKALQTQLLQQQTKELEDQKAADAAKKERDAAALAGNRIGMRSLLSQDWLGFNRGGDLGAK